MQLKSLNCNFLTEVELLKLNLANIQTTDQLITYADLNFLSEKTKIPVKTLQLIRKFIIGQYAPFPEQSHSILNRMERKSFYIQTGCPQIDELLMNGVFSNEITEITGPSASGKTEFCLNLVASLMIKNTLNNVLYIDSNRSFCPIRMRHLVLDKLNASNFSTEQNLKRIMDSIRVVECSSPFHLLDMLYNLKKPSSSSKLPSTIPTSHIQIPTLLVIDNLNNLFRSIFKPGYTLDAAFFLACISNQLKYLATNFNIAVVVVTNSSESQTNRMSNLFSLPNWVFTKLLFLNY